MKKVIYEGEATLGRQGNIKPNGHGKMKYLDGEYEDCRYEGDFVDGYADGRGKWYDKDGNIEYEGQWSEGMYHGQGTEYYTDGTPPRTGRWINGEPVDENASPAG